MITDKKVALKQLEKRFNFFCHSLQKRIAAKIPLDYKKIHESIPLSPKLVEDEDIIDTCKRLAQLEVEMMEELIKARLKEAENNSEIKEIIEKRLKEYSIKPSGLLEILELIF